MNRSHVDRWEPCWRICHFTKKSNYNSIRHLFGSVILFRKRKILCKVLPAAPITVQPSRALFAQGWWVCRLARQVRRWAPMRGLDEGLDEKRHCRKPEEGEWAGKGQFRCPPPAEQREGREASTKMQWGVSFDQLLRLPSCRTPHFQQLCKAESCCTITRAVQRAALFC